MTQRSKSISAAVAELELERDRLQARVDTLERRQADIGRKLYRRGYLAGRAAQRRGAPLTTAPERHARGWAREAIG